jgi:hypothetical protein
MLRPGNRVRQALFTLAACLLIAAGSGCGARAPWSTAQEGLLEEVDVSELQPGGYCEIDMVVPPLAPEGSGHHFNGTVQEVTHEEIVLVNVLEQTNVDYAVSSRQRPLARKRRDLVRVPRLGIDKIWAYPPGKGAAGAKPPVASNVTLPSVGPQPPPVTPAVPAPAVQGSPPDLNRLAAPPPDAPARFDAPPQAGNFTR